MKQWKQSMFLILAGAILALLTGISSHSATYCYDISKHSAAEVSAVHPNSDESTEAVLESRIPFQQLLSRNQRNSSLQGFHSRDTGLLKRNAKLSQQSVFIFENNFNGFPPSYTFRYSKDYYVYTLKHILC